MIAESNEEHNKRAHPQLMQHTLFDVVEEDH